jgi:integrase
LGKWGDYSAYLPFRAVSGRSHSQTDRLEALYVLAIHTGLRQGELHGLKWDDLDLTITKNGSVFTTPKTPGFQRSEKLTSKATEALKSHLECQLAEDR